MKRLLVFSPRCPTALSVRSSPKPATSESQAASRHQRAEDLTMHSGTKTGNVLVNLGSFLVSVSVLLLSLVPASAKMVTYVKEYTYTAGEMDSKLSSRAIALEQVKRLLLEELGTYIFSETTVKNYKVTKDEITSIASGIVMTIIVEERWDGKTYYLKAKINTDVDDLGRSINKALKDDTNRKNFQDMSLKMEDTLRELERLKKERGSAEQHKRTQEKYAKTVQSLDAMTWFKEGYRFFVAEDYDEAMTAYDKAIAIDPEYASPYAGQAVIYNRRRQWQKGFVSANRAIDINPKLPWAYHSRGVSHRGMKNFEESIADYNKAIELDPYYAWPYASRGYSYYKLKRYDQALSDTNKAIALQPGLHWAYIYRGLVLTSITQYDDAIKDFGEAIRLNPKESYAYLWRGEAYVKQNKNEQALKDFKTASDLGNNEAKEYLRSKGMR